MDYVHPPEKLVFGHIAVHTTDLFLGRRAYDAIIRAGLLMETGGTIVLNLGEHVDWENLSRPGKLSGS